MVSGDEGQARAPEPASARAAEPAGAPPAWRRPATRVWLITTTLTAAVLLTVGFFVYSTGTQWRAVVDDDYSRKSAYVAEEVDLRVDTYQRLVEVVGNAALRLAHGDVETAKSSSSDLVVQARARRDAAIAAEAWLRARSKQADAKKNDQAGKTLSAVTTAEGRSDEEVRLRETLAEKEDALGKAQLALDTARSSTHLALESSLESVDGGLDGAVRASASQGDASTSQVSSPDLAAALSAYSSAVKATQAAQKNADDADTRAAAGYDDLKGAIALWGKYDGAATLAGRKKAAANDDVLAKSRSYTDAMNAADRAEQDLRTGQNAARLSFEQTAADACPRGSADMDLCRARAILAGLLDDPPGAHPEDVVQGPPRGGATSQMLVDGDYGYLPIADQDAPDHAAPGSKPAAPSAPIRQLRVALSALVPEGATWHDRSTPPGGTRFDEVLLVDAATRHVLFATATDPQARVTLLPQPSGATPVDKDKSTDRPAPQWVDLGAQRYAIFERAVRTVSVAPRCPPATAQCDATTQPSSLLAVGLVREDRLTDQARGLSPLMFLLAVVATALGVFAWPLAKLWLVGAHSRFSRTDMILLGTSALGGTLLVVLLGLAIAARLSLDRRLDGQLEVVARGLSDRLTDDADAGKEALRSFANDSQELRQELTELPADAGVSDAGPQQLARSGCMAFGRQQRALGVDAGDPDASAVIGAGAGSGSVVEAPAGWVQWAQPDQGCSVFACEVTLPDVHTHPGSWSSTFWANEHGCEQVQVTDGRNGTPPVSVAKREYFQALWNRGPQSADESVVAQVVRSMTKTDKLLLFARPTIDGDGRQSGIAAHEIDLGHFDRVTLPGPIQWAVIDPHGQVMLHSDIEDHHGHSLLEDLDSQSQQRLLAAMADGAEDSFRGTYGGARSLLHVRHNESTNWTVVAIGSLAANDMALGTTLKTTVVVYGAFLVVVVLAVLLYVARIAIRDSRRGERHAFDLQPRADSSTLYARAARRMATGSVLLAGVALLLGPWVPVLLLLVASAAVLVGTAAGVPGVWSDPSSKPAGSLGDAGRPTPRLDFAFTACCATFALIAVVAPTTICFVGAFSAASQELVEREERDVAKAPPCTKRAWARGCADLLPRVEPSTPPEVSETTIHEGPPIDEVEDACLGVQSWPLGHLMSVLSAGTLPATQSPRVCVRHGAWAIDLLERPSARHPPLLHGEAVYLLKIGAGYATLLFVGGCVVVAVVLATAFFSIRRLFFIDVLASTSRIAAPAFLKLFHAPPQHSLAPGTPLPPSVLVIFPPPVDESERSDVLHLDGAKLSLETEARNLLAELEKAGSGGKLVLSNVDPLRRVPPTSTADWARALSRFTVERGPGAGAALDTDARCLLAWNESDAEEQRVLAQLAFDGHVSPHPSNGSVLLHLAGRSLLEPNTLRMQSDRFAEFVRNTVGQDQMRAWEAGETDVSWDVVRVPLLSSLAVLIGLISTLHPEFADGEALIVPSLAGGLPAALRLAAAMLGGNKGAKS